MSRMWITVSLERPREATADDVISYVLDAVTAWRGSLEPPGMRDTLSEGDPMWELDPDTVYVIKARRPRRTPQ